MSSFQAEKLDAASALAGLRQALPDWTPEGTWGLQTRVRGERLHLAVVVPVGSRRWGGRAAIALQDSSGRSFHYTVESALARVARLVA